MDRGGWVYVDLFRFVTHVFRVALTFVQFVLALFPDKEKSSVFMAGEVCVCVCVVCVCAVKPTEELFYVHRCVCYYLVCQKEECVVYCECSLGFVHFPYFLRGHILNCLQHFCHGLLGGG